MFLSLNSCSFPCHLKTLTQTNIFSKFINRDVWFICADIKNEACEVEKAIRVTANVAHENAKARFRNTT